MGSGGSVPQATTIFVIALLSRLLVWLCWQGSALADDYRVDTLYFLRWAQGISEGQWVAPHVFEQGPLYAYLLGLYLRIAGPDPSGMILLQILIGSVSCGCVPSICRMAGFRERTRFGAGLLCALYGPAIATDCELMKTFLSPAMTLFFLWFSMHYLQTQRTAWLLGASACVALACLERESHVLLFLILVLVTLWVDYRNTGRVTAGFKRVVACAALFGLVILPATLHNWLVARELVLVTAGGGEVLYMGHGPYADAYYHAPPFVEGLPGKEHADFRAEAARRVGHPLSAKESSRYWTREAISYAMQHPVRELKLCLKKLLVFLNDYEVPDTADYYVTRRLIPGLQVLPTWGWIIGCGCGGMILSARKILASQPNLNYLLLIGAVLSHATTVVVTYNFGRFRLGAAPVVGILAMYFLQELYISYQVRGWRLSVQSWWLVVLAMTVSVLSFAPIEPPGYRIGEKLLAAELLLKDGNVAAARPLYAAVIQDVSRETMPAYKYQAIDQTTAYLGIATIEALEGNKHQVIAALDTALNQMAQAKSSRKLQNRLLLILRSVIHDDANAGISGDLYEPTLERAIHQVANDPVLEDVVVTLWLEQRAGLKPGRNPDSAYLWSFVEQTCSESSHQEQTEKTWRESWLHAGSALVAGRRGDHEVMKREAQKSLLADPQIVVADELKECLVP